MLKEKRLRSFTILHIAGIVALGIYAKDFYPLYILYIIGFVGHYMMVKSYSQRDNPETIKGALKWHFLRFILVAVMILVIAFLNQKWLIPSLIIYTFQLLILFISIKS